MLIVEMKNGLNIDRALKMLKNKVAKTKQVKKLRENQAYIKPSVEKRDGMKKAIYVQSLRQKEMDGNDK